MSFAVKFMLLLMSIHPALVSADELLQRKDKLNGELFYVSAHNAPPFQIITRGENGSVKSYTGCFPEIFYLVAQTLNFTYILVPENDTEIMINGAVNASITNIMNGNVYINTAGMMMTPERLELIDFSYPFWIGPFRLLVPRPGEESRLFAFIRPFQPLVWISLALGLIAMVVVLSLFHWIVNERNPRIGSNVVYIIAIICNHGQQPPFVRRHAFLMLIAIWVLAATVLVNSYSGVVISALTVPKMKKAVDSFEDLAISEDVTLSIQPDTILGNTIMRATSGVYKTLGDQLRQHPDRLYKTAGKTLLEKIETKRYAIPQSEYTVRFFMASDVKKSGTCHFQMSSPLPYTQLSQFGLPKNGIYNRIISQTVRNLWETGLNAYHVKNAIPRNSDKCAGENKESAQQVPIKLVDLTSAFLILGIGLGFSIVSFLIECCVHFKWRP